MRISITRLDTDDDDLEVVQINEGSMSVLGTVDDGSPMLLEVQRGQSFMIREKYVGLGDDVGVEPGDRRNFDRRQRT